jgi:hypothetical protein
MSLDTVNSHNPNSLACRSRTTSHKNRIEDDDVCGGGTGARSQDETLDKLQLTLPTQCKARVTRRFGPNPYAGVYAECFAFKRAATVRRPPAYTTM